MSDALRVLWIIHGAETYGEARAIRSLMHGVRESGWQAEAITLTQGTCYQQLVDDGFRVTCIHIDRTPSLHLAPTKLGKLWQFAKMIKHQFPVRRRVLEELQQRRPDIVHFLTRPILPAIGWAAMKAGVPCFWEMTATVSGGFFFNINQRIYRQNLDRFNIQTLANSQYTAGTISGLKLPARVMHLGANPRQFNPEVTHALTRSQFGIPDGALVFIMVSRIDPSKGQELFLQAAREVNDPRVHVLLLGDVPSEAEWSYLQKLKHAYAPDSGGRAHFAGYSASPEAYIALADVGVNARVDPEPFGLSVVEIMMMGKPMLVHALGGPAETVVEGQSGWHVKEPTVKAFAEGIRRSLADHAQWHAMGNNARCRALEQFSVDQQVRRYREFVTERLATVQSTARAKVHSASS